MPIMFEEPQYIYSMPRGKSMSKCPYNTCSATSPPVRASTEDELRSVSDANRSKAGRNEIQTCFYCSGLWWEEWEPGRADGRRSASCPRCNKPRQERGRVVWVPGQLAMASEQTTRYIPVM